jgi:chromosome segregation and condensation protein ScpB
LVSDTFGPRNAGQQPPEELVETQAISVDLREAVMACLSGRESRRWTVLELVERFKNLGVCASRANVTAALAELEVELELCAWAPWKLLERGTEWILAPKSELSALLAGERRLPVKDTLSDEHKAVLLVVIGYRRKGGVSKARVEEILGLEASRYLDELLRQELIYSDPSRDLNFWRPTQSALLALGFRSFGDIPALKELEEWFEAQQKKEKIPRAKLDRFFDRTGVLGTLERKVRLSHRQRLLRRRGGYSLSTTGLRNGRSSPRATVSGITNEYRPNMLMWSWISGESLATSASKTWCPSKRN